ncbi:hypothetical protein AAL_02024 [Moelleriella libera RCEF 2490]|uniref:FAD-dependent oxidoreductase-like enzyme n=1 Tax=Moelleriella libera RCEF 2490 TaxID=1081109 RepID=A0A162IWK5_9HYPO|nr:hypothetical protein AAL_02024 [Moelleriella libera RCEF 2490]
MASDDIGETSRCDSMTGSPGDAPTPQEADPPPDSSQLTLPSTEIPASPVESGQFLKSEGNEDDPASGVVPSSLTPPPSTQVTARGIVQETPAASQQPSLFSPPATAYSMIRDREIDSRYSPPTSSQIDGAPAEDLRSLLQNCIAEHHKMKLEAAHYKLQYSLLSLQAEDDAQRSAVEHEMVRREVDALRTTDNTRQMRDELSVLSDLMEFRYRALQAKHESVSEENEALHHQLQMAERVIQLKEEEVLNMSESHKLLLNRIRENREHFNMLRNTPGVFNEALSPQTQMLSTPQQHAAHQTGQSRDPQSWRWGEAGNARERYGPAVYDPMDRFSVLLEAASQSQFNNSAPSTPTPPHRAVQRHVGKHNRNTMSLSSLPTTPLNRPDHVGLMPSVHLVPQTDPRDRYSQAQRERGRKSRESTISEIVDGNNDDEEDDDDDDDDNDDDDDDEGEQVARQPVGSVGPSQSRSADSSGLARGRSRVPRNSGDDRSGTGEPSGSHASRAAANLLRRSQPRDTSAALHDLLGSPLPSLQPGAMSMGLEKRKFNSSLRETAGPWTEQSSSPKKTRPGSSRRGHSVGLGIQYE